MAVFTISKGCAGGVWQEQEGLPAVISELVVTVLAPDVLS